MHSEFLVKVNAFHMAHNLPIDSIEYCKINFIFINFLNKIALKENEKR